MGVFVAGVIIFMVLRKSNSIPQGHYNLLSTDRRTGRQEEGEGESSVCGSTLEIGLDGRGVLKSSMRNGQYLPEHSCMWIIRAASRTRILIASKEFAVENSMGCIWDYLEMRDGADGLEANVGRFCGYNSVSYISTTSILYLHFFTDADIQDFGFVLEYSAINPDEIPSSKCNALVDAPAEGHVTSPNYPSNYDVDMDCYYRIRAPTGMVVIFQVTDLDVSPCDFDTVSTFDGNNSRRSMLWSSCEEDPIWPLKSTGRDLFVHFQSRYFETKRGFNLTYRFVLDMFTRPVSPTVPSTNGGDADCSGVIELGENGILTSPLYPDIYPDNKDCRWELRCVDHALRVKLHFKVFSLEQSDNCTFDYLQVFWNGSDLQKSDKYCSEDLHDKIIFSQGPTFRLEFMSDISIGTRGFEIHYQSVDVTLESCDPSCIDGEVCVSDDMGEFFCFTGRHCDSNQCLNGGICVDDDSFPECFCSVGFNGEFCEEVVNTEPLKFLYLPKYSHKTVPEGDSVVFDCGIENPGTPYNLMWLLDKRMLSEDGEGGITAHAGGLLQIDDFNEAHEGNYTCFVTTKHRSAEAHVYLDFVQECQLHVFIPPADKVVKTGKIILMECYVPEASVQTWSKESRDGLHHTITYDDRISIMSNGFLKIMNATVEDSGQYSCSSESEYGCRVTRTGRLRVIENVAVKDVCGIDTTKHGEVTMKITNGRQAKMGTTPWHVIFNNITQGNKKAFCGGSLISDRWIVTAGHCIMAFGPEFTNDNVELYLGTEKCLGEEGKAHPFRQYIVHEHFNKTTFMNYDIALIELTEPVEFTDDISPVCLEPYEYISEEFFRYYRGKSIGRVVGCGKIMDRVSPKTLKEVYVPYVDDEYCNISAETNGKKYTESMLCAGYQYANIGDACNGDSGGSLTMNVQEDGVWHWVLTGIVSWGVGCDQEGQYGFYANVGRLYDWIKLNTQPY